MASSVAARPSKVMPADETRAGMPRSWSRARRSASAIGDRQMLPVQRTWTSMGASMGWIVGSRSALLTVADMAVDPRTPVIVGAGQVNQRTAEGDPAREPVDLIIEAARRAATDADTSGDRLLESIDSVRVVSLLSWRYRDPGALVAERIGATPKQTAVTTPGG